MTKGWNLIRVTLCFLKIIYDQSYLLISYIILHREMIAYMR